MAPLREKFQLKVEENIEKKENNIQKIRLEINDLESFYQEHTKYPKPEDVNYYADDLMIKRKKFEQKKTIP